MDLIFNLKNLSKLKSHIEPKLKHLKLPVAEYSFANLFLFRDLHKYELKGDFISGQTRKGAPFSIPLLPPPFLMPDSQLFPIPEKWLAHFPEDMYERHYSPNDSDYLFDSQKLRTYEGRKLSSKRNLIYQFLDQNDPVIKAYESSYKFEAQEVLKEWELAAKGVGAADIPAANEALELYEDLNLSGYLIFDRDVPIGFIMGELLLPELYVIHFAKGKPGYKGLYPFMYQSLAKRLPDSVEMVNFEQDLGIPSLKQAKQSFYPDEILKKYYIKKRPVSNN